VKWRLRIERTALVAAMTLAAINLWTGAPLLGLWVGSRVAPDSGISTAAVAVVLVVMLGAALTLIRALNGLRATYDRLTGNAPVNPRQTPWLRSLSGDRPTGRDSARAHLDVLDYVLVCVVVGCILAFEAWLFFFAGSPLPVG
jgi:hypothetical protein